MRGRMMEEEPMLTSSFLVYVHTHGCALVGTRSTNMNMYTHTE